jgi:lipopolysaccharide/colanic/teichoic acid biosynthesis glycosyltransferase
MMTKLDKFSSDFPPANERLSLVEKSVKRVMDIVIAILGLLISLPIFIIVAVIIRMDSPGPILIRQKRVGKNGKSFQLLKFRSMYADAEKNIHTVLGDNPLKNSTLKVQDDPRVTPAGRVLRRWSIDEFPQFWNVLLGDMSMVGPRPEERWIVELYDQTQIQRLAVKPGLTGPMQISGRGALDMDARLALELNYIDNFSIWNDLKILVKTIPVLISGKGAY